MSPLPVRVLYILRGGVIGGITSGLLGLLRHLHPGRCRAVVITEHRSPALPLFRQQGVPCMDLPLHQRQAFLRRIIERERIQLVQTCNPITEGACVAHQMGIPHVWFIGNRLENDFAVPSPPRSLHALHALIDRSSSAIVVPSRALARAEFPGLPARKLKIIPWGIDLPSPPPPHEAGGRVPLIALVANFYPTKRHLDFLKAATRIHRLFPEARFVIAGRCLHSPPPSVSRLSRRYRARVVEEIRRRRLNAVMTMTQFSPENRIPWYRQISLILSTSIEGLSQALLEAGACGIPVIAVKAGGTPEVFQHGRSGILVHAGDTDAMADAAVRILRDPSWGKRLGLAARRRILTHFTAQRHALRFHRLYHELLPTRPGSRIAGQ